VRWLARMKRLRCGRRLRWAEEPSRGGEGRALRIIARISDPAMSMTTLLLAALALAVLPTVLIVVNLAILKPPPPLQGQPPVRGRERVPDAPSRRDVLGDASSGGIAGSGVSVLIPARNEERHIGAAIESVLADGPPDLEVIVLDDGSDDGTAPIVREAALRDSRVSLRHGLPVPQGFCGKPFACLQLAQAAKGGVLV